MGLLLDCNLHKVDITHESHSSLYSIYYSLNKVSIVFHQKPSRVRILNTMDIYLVLKKFHFKFSSESILSSK